VNPAEIIRAKRDGQALSRAQIDAFVHGLAAPEGAGGRWADSQAGAMAMAIVLRGMSAQETVELADAMTHSGRVLDWSAQTGSGLHGPVLDKHSTGGVGDKVSLMLAPMLAACGAVVPMISGRGLGHTGGTLDKLEALPGYGVDPPPALLLHTLRTAGCAIVGASSDLAPADRRLYAIRDVTATVESVPLITASILSKKRAAGLHGLVMDVKLGSGAFAARPEDAQALAQSLVQVATQAGLPTVALITDMNQVLGSTAGNALEVAEAIALLTARGMPDARLLEVTLALGAELLHLGGLQPTVAAARAALQHSLDSGAAAERFARMVAALGGPANVLQAPGLPVAPVQRPVPAPRGGWVAAIDVRALGLAVVALGGGRAHPADRVDPRVGLADVVPLRRALAAGEPLATVHAAREAAAAAAVAAVQAACTLADAAPAAAPAVVLQRVAASGTG
jgi:thymidine phosphorylase